MSGSLATKGASVLAVGSTSFAKASTSASGSFCVGGFQPS